MRATRTHERRPPLTTLAAPRGTADLLPPESYRWQLLEERIRRIALRFGYGEIRTPMFESTELFVRGVGETTDIVEKEMYTFVDKGGRSMTLRPEWTAPVVRALLQHKLLAGGQEPQRLFYVGPFFRYERPQAGRYRQAHQFGVECFGFAGPEADVEVIQLALEVLRAYELADVRLELNSIGDARCRSAYREALLVHFRPHASALSQDSQRRLERNPLRILDSKAAADRPFIERAPTFLELLCEECRAHFDGVRTYLDAMGITYHVNPRLVRGFDYYTRTVFELSSSVLGSQSAVCGGGRYDALVESLGGPPTPAVGFGLGLERFLMIVAAGAADGAPVRAGMQIIALGPSARARLVPLIAALRRVAGDVPIFADYGDRKLQAQFKAADRNNAAGAVVAGDDELARRELKTRDLGSRVEGTLPFDDEPEAAAERVLRWYRAEFTARG